MSIPFLDIKSEQKFIKDEILAAIARVIESGQYILGPEVKALEDRIAAYSGVSYGIGVSSGTDALLVSLMALDIGHSDEVITTDYSFFATAGAIARVGAKPVFVDIDSDTYNLDPRKLESAITAQTKAIIVVHLFGQCADMHAIREIADKHEIAIIEDAAQAIGAQYSDGMRAGSFGRLGCFSFFPTKNLGAVGDGGMVVTSDSDLAEKVGILRAHGAKPKYYHRLIGGNFRLDSIQAAVLSVKLAYLDQWSKARQCNADQYRDIFEDTDLIEREHIRLPESVYRKEGVPFYHIYNQFVIRAQSRDRLRDYLSAQGIATEVYYPVPFHQQECFRVYGYGEERFPEAELAARETLALPISPGLSEASINKIADSIRHFYA